MKRCLIKIIPLLCFVLFISGFEASAEQIFNSYTYDSQKQAVYAPDAVRFAGKFNIPRPETGAGEIVDIVCGGDGRIYVLDGPGGTLSVYSSEGEQLLKISEFETDEGLQKFKNPSGLFITPEMEIYIADTENGRIVQLDANGKFVRLLGEPESPLLDTQFGYKPSKIAVDSVGQIYVVPRDFTNGVIVMDSNGEFLSCIGAPRVRFSFIDFVWKQFSTQEQLDRMIDFVPTEYNNISIDQNDFLFVTCSTYGIWDYISGNVVSLRKLNARGDDILLPSAQGDRPFGDLTVVPSGAYRGGSVLVDSQPLNYGMFSVMDSNRCKIFVYNSDSELLFTMGAPGAVQGGFQKPVAMSWDGSRFFVADALGSSVTIFEPTDYGNDLILTARLNAEGEYEEEQNVWGRILQRNANNLTAVRGMARSAYDNGDYKSAMAYYKLVDDKVNYSKAFVIHRREIINEYAWLILLCAGLFAVAVAALRILTKKGKLAVPSARGFTQPLFYSKRVIFRPLSGMWDLTRRNKGSLSAAHAILGLGTLMMLLQAYGTGYISAGRRAQETLLIIPLIQLGLIIFLVSVCNWCVSSLLDGKGIFKNIWITNCYAVVPIVLLFPAIIALSHVLGYNELDLNNMLITLAYAWTALLIICGNMQVHEYSMGKSLFVLFITLIVMLIVVFLFVLFLILIQQMILFSADILQDIRTYGG